MGEGKQDFPYIIGFGLCKEDFTIEENKVAAFLSQKDAEAYVRNIRWNDLSFNSKVFYVDAQVQDKLSMLTVRYIYDNKQDKFIEGNDIVSSRKEIYIPGYEVSAAFINEENEEDVYEYSETTVCFSSSAAEQGKQRYFEDGADEVYIDDKDIGIKEYFWNADKFLQGGADNKRIEKIINDIRNTPFKPGESIYQKIGIGLENVSTEEMKHYFEKNIIGGASLIRDYIESQIINSEINWFRSRDSVGRERQ